MTEAEIQIEGYELFLRNDTNWNINKVTKKTNSTLAFLCRNLRYCSSKLKELAYNSLVGSTLEYASTVWDPHLVKDIMKLVAVQRRAARFVVGDFCRWSSVTEMQKQMDAKQSWSEITTKADPWSRRNIYTEKRMKARALDNQYGWMRKLSPR